MHWSSPLFNSRAFIGLIRKATFTDSPPEKSSSTPLNEVVPG